MFWHAWLMTFCSDAHFLSTCRHRFSACRWRSSVTFTLLTSWRFSMCRSLTIMFLSDKDSYWNDTNSKVSKWLSLVLMSLSLAMFACYIMVGNTRNWLYINCTHVGNRTQAFSHDALITWLPHDPVSKIGGHSAKLSATDQYDQESSLNQKPRLESNLIHSNYLFCQV